MLKRILPAATAGALLTLTLVPRANAFPVTDIGAITQLITQIDYWKQQIQGMTDQLAQLKSSYDAMTGTRGMERLLSGTARNYLPANWSQLEDVFHSASASFRSLSSDLKAAIDKSAVLTPEQLAALSPAERAQVEDARRSAAMLQVTTRQAIETTSARFASIQQLIDAIPSATDAKGILDLQARIQAEQGMLTNEATKLQMLVQTAQAEEWAREQRAVEQGIEDIGSLRRLPPMHL